MRTHEIISKLRNPYGVNEKEMRAVRLAAADKIESLEDAYQNMKKFAESNGLDTTTYSAGGAPPQETSAYDGNWREQFEGVQWDWLYILDVDRYGIQKSRS